jgi:hypothetical protein
VDDSAVVSFSVFYAALHGGGTAGQLERDLEEVE